MGATLSRGPSTPVCYSLSTSSGSLFTHTPQKALWEGEGAACPL